MKYKLVKDMFPEYLEETNIVAENDKVTIYFSSKRKECHCPSCNTPSTKKSTYFALTESAEAASRRCSRININVTGDTLLRLSKKWEPDIDKSSIRAIGIDDFAFKKNIITEQL